jgi:NAD(P)-dependent dehydrogenase (short-subunit alcohol dehydrogenase family)
MRLQGKRLLVVGSSSGLGRESAIAAVAEGARVCFAARRSDRIEDAAREAGNGAFALRCDVRDESSCQAVVAGAVEVMGGLDGLVYTPAISTFGPIEKIDAESWRDVLATNLIGPSLILNAAIEHLESSRGKVVIFSSIVIDDSPPRPQQASYVISKVALEVLIEAWQGEHRDVGFTSIASGDSVSEFGFGHDLEKLGPIVQKWGELGYMYGRLMDASAVAEQVIHALSSRETVRRIAITPSYAPTEAHHGADSGRAELEQMRGKADG